MTLDEYIDLLEKNGIEKLAMQIARTEAVPGTDAVEATEDTPEQPAIEEIPAKRWVIFQVGTIRSSAESAEVALTSLLSTLGTERKKAIAQHQAALLNLRAIEKQLEPPKEEGETVEPAEDLAEVTPTETKPAASKPASAKKGASKKK